MDAIAGLIETDKDIVIISSKSYDDDTEYNLEEFCAIKLKNKKFSGEMFKAVFLSTAEDATTSFEKEFNKRYNCVYEEEKKKVSYFANFINDCYIVGYPKWYCYGSIYYLFGRNGYSICSRKFMCLYKMASEIIAIKKLNFKNTNLVDLYNYFNLYSPGYENFQKKEKESAEHTATISARLFLHFVDLYKKMNIKKIEYIDENGCSCKFKNRVNKICSHGHIINYKSYLNKRPNNKFHLDKMIVRKNKNNTNNIYYILTDEDDSEISEDFDETEILDESYEEDIKNKENELKNEIVKISEGKITSVNNLYIKQHAFDFKAKNS